MAEKSWQQMDKEELRRNYNCSDWHPTLPRDSVVPLHTQKIEHDSAISYESVPCQRNVRYGKTEREVVDIFGEAILPKDAPVYCYIHGGYWMLMSHNQYALNANDWCDDGVIFSLLEYDLAPRVTLAEIVQQTRRGVRFLIERFKARGSSGLYLAGHSAGGHLVASILADDEIMATNFIKGALCISMVADVEPLIHTVYNEDLKLTVEEARSLSPSHHTSQIAANCKRSGSTVSILVGEFDSPEFIRQSREFHQALTDHGLTNQFTIDKDVDHFDVVWNARGHVKNMMNKSDVTKM